MSEHAYRSLSLERGLKILLLFNDASPTRTIGELADALGLSRASAHRYVATLVELDYLQRCRGKRSYRLGSRAVSLGLSALNTMDVRRIGKPHVERLSRDLGYTVTIGILVDLAVMEIEKVRSGPSIDLNNDPGVRLPAYCTAQGKVLLAALREPERANHVRSLRLTALTANTITRHVDLLDELSQVARRGFGTNNEEFVYGLRGVAAPIRDASGEIIASVGISGYASQTPLRELRGILARHVLETAAAISADLGYPAARSARPATNDRPALEAALLRSRSA